jgi:hypothetical protein
MAVWIVMRWNAPPLSIVHDGSKLTVDVNTLGEYQTTVTRIRLSDVNSRAVVWDLRQPDGTAQIHGFTLNVGKNAAQLDSIPGSYRIVVPSDSGTFVLRKGAEYRLELWGGSTILSKRSFSFLLGAVR